MAGWFLAIVQLERDSPDCQLIWNSESGKIGLHPTFSMFKEGVNKFTEIESSKYSIRLQDASVRMSMFPIKL